MFRFGFDCRFIRLTSNVVRAMSGGVSTESSLVSGPSSPPLINLTVGQALQRSAVDFGSVPAVISKHQRLTKTWAEVRQEAEQLACSFLRSGLKHGDRIGIWGTNSYQWQLTQFSAAIIGAVLVNVNQAYQMDELRYCLNHVGIDTLVAADGYKSSDYYTMLDTLSEGRLSAGGVNDMTDLRSALTPSLRQVVMISEDKRRGVVRFDDFFRGGALIDRGELEHSASRVQPGDACSVQFTSGTTGRPKGATLSHHSILNNALLTASRAGLGTQSDGCVPLRLCVPVPLYHCFGCVLGSLVALLHGHTLVFPAPTFSATQTLEAVQEYRCDALYGTPTMFVDLLNVPNLSDYDLTSLRSGLTAGAPLSPTLMHQMIHTLHMSDAVVGYGLTEASPLLTLCSPSDTLSRRCETVGRALPHTSLCVQHVETGRLLARNTPGQLCSSGYSSFIGYWAQPDATRRSFTDDGWLRTGDIGEITDEGYVKIIGRSSDMVIRGGENIYPAEIESFLMTHPDIAEAYVFGVADARMGEELCVWIRTKEERQLSVDSVKQFFAGKLAHFKVPRYIQFRDDFPKTVTGKVQKYRMREIMAAELKAGQLQLFLPEY